MVAIALTMTERFLLIIILHGSSDTRLALLLISVQSSTHPPIYRQSEYLGHPHKISVATLPLCFYHSPNTNTLITGQNLIKPLRLQHFF